MHYSDQLVPVIETPAGLFETARVVASVRGVVISWLAPSAAYVPLAVHLRLHVCFVRTVRGQC